MAILTSGITGPAAGKCAGVQFFKARTKSGKITAARIHTVPTAPRSEAQIAYQNRLQLIRDFWLSTHGRFASVIKNQSTAPFGWFADFYQLLAPMFAAPAPAFSFKTTGNNQSRYGEIPIAPYRFLRNSSTSFSLIWPNSNYLPGQSGTDYLYATVFSCTHPMSRAAGYYLYNFNLTTRSVGQWNISGIAASIPIVVIATFANHNTNPTKRDPLSIMTPQT